MINDITERKRTERALRESHDRLLTVLDGLDSDIYASDLKTYEILFMNRHMRESFGDNLVGQFCWQVLRGEAGPCPHCTNDRLIDMEGNPTGAVTWEGKNPITGKSYINHDRAIKWVDGRLARLQIATDITERKRVEDALRQSEESYRGLFNSVAEAIYIQDADGRFLDVNEGAVKMYGRPREFFIGNTPEPLGAPGRNNLAKIAETIKAAFEQGDDRPTGVTAEKQGDQIVFTIANGRRSHTVTRSTDPAGLKSSDALRVEGGSFVDSTAEGPDLVFYRVE